MLYNVVLNEWNDDVGTAHHTAADDYDLRIVGVYQSNRSGSPNANAAVTDAPSDLVAVRQLKNRAEVYLWLLYEFALSESGPLLRDQWQGPSRGLRFGATDCSTGALAATEQNGQVSTEASALNVFPAHQLTVHHRCAANSRAKGDHYYVFKSPGCPGELFTKQRHSGIVFDFERQTEFPPAPRRQVQPRRIVILLVRREDAAGARIREPTEAKRKAFTRLQRNTESSQQILKRRNEQREHRTEPLGPVQCKLLRSNNRAIFNYGQCGVRATQVDYERFHKPSELHGSRGYVAVERTMTAKINTATPII